MSNFSRRIKKNRKNSSISKLAVQDWILMYGHNYPNLINKVKEPAKFLLEQMETYDISVKAVAQGYEDVTFEWENNKELPETD